MTYRPRLLDLFCCQGGASKGYHDAGFDVVGVDTALKRLPDGTWTDDKAIPARYPFEFIKADAFEVLADTAFMAQFDAYHGSPPCHDHMRTPHPDKHGTGWMLAATRERFAATGKPWVIENVPGAPMRADYLLCGCMFGLPNLRRERWFETSWHGFAMNTCHDHSEPAISVVGHGTPTWVRSKLGYNPTIAQYRAAMGIGWMNREGLSQAIPPAYTRLVGAQLLEHLRAREAA